MTTFLSLSQSGNWVEVEEYIYPISAYSVQNLSEKGTANCYVISASGKYKFNATVKGESKESVGAPISAKVLWESFGSSEQPSVGDIVRDIKFDSGSIYFKTPNEIRNGNAVIAAVDVTGRILWSWHIWICVDFDPELTAQNYKNNIGTMMDRNLGATSAEKGDFHSLGLLFQWGRKDPFLNSSSISNSYSVSSSTIVWPNSVESGLNTGTIEYSIMHPTTLICYNDLNNDWLFTSTTSTDNTRWQKTNLNKGVFDPCPHGWRVPDNEIWVEPFGGSYWYYQNGPWDDNNKGMNFGSGNGHQINHQLGSATTIWYPASGHIAPNYYGNMVLSDVGDCATYWASERGMNFFKGSNMMVHPYVGQHRGFGGAVRCCKDK